MEKRQITAPPDVELGLPREPLDYFLVAPDKGIGEKTGLIFWVVGWGMDPDGRYSIEKLMPYLANTHDCLVVSLKYHGQGIKAQEPHIENIKVTKAWLDAVQQRYGVTMDGNEIASVFRKLSDRGVEDLPRDLSVYVDYGTQYLSFGFLPALDHIAVLGEVLKEFPVDRGRIMALGSSYGGYIISLMLKFMPHTLSLAIDNSGFSKVLREELSCEDSGMRQLSAGPGGIKFRAIVISPWKLRDERSPGYFRPAFSMIRDLTLIDHMQPCETQLYLFHSRIDHLAPYAEKEAFAKMRAQFAPTYFTEVTEADIDGRVFKTLDHGLQASMRGLFDLVADRAGSLVRTNALTDFDRETRVSLQCQDYKYHFTYAKDFTFTCSLEKLQW